MWEGMCAETMSSSQDFERGKRIKQAREAKGLSQQALSNAVGVNAGQISRLERGLNAPSGQVLSGLCEALEVTADWLLNGRSAPTGRVLELTPEQLASIPPMEELLQPDPDRPGWNEALEKLLGVLETLQPPQVWFVRTSLSDDPSPPYEHYRELIFAFQRIEQSREMGS